MDYAAHMPKFQEHLLHLQKDWMKELSNRCFLKHQFAIVCPIMNQYFVLCYQGTCISTITKATIQISIYPKLETASIVITKRLI